MKKHSMLALALILTVAFMTGCSTRENMPMYTTTPTQTPTVEMPTDTQPMTTAPTTEATSAPTESTGETGDPTVSPTTESAADDTQETTLPSDGNGITKGRSRKIPGMR